MYSATLRTLKTATWVTATGILCLIVSGCAQQNQPVSEADACQALNHVIGQAPSGFKSLRGASTADYDHIRWDAKPILPGTECDIGEWAGGRVNYGCTWDQGNQATAKANYDQGLALVSQCVGAGWTVSEPAGNTGKATRFSRPNSPTTVEVRYYRERPPSTNWQTSLTVGPPITRDAR
ncbi:MAG: hypothetical protein ACK443_03915 [Methylococcaceae bacterium]|jgi:hypothetical protein